MQRRERVIAGKYGVGLLGFWAVGHRFELRSRVNGSESWALSLVEDEPGARIHALPTPLDAAQTFTDAIVLELHEAALRSLSGARLASYLGSELRGQLLARDIELVVRDSMARGTAQKRFDVRPKRFLGEKLDVPREIPTPVARYAPVRVELYFARGDASAAVQIACAGTVVADSVRDLGGLEIDDGPWIGREIVGVLDFPELNVPPGTRRGVVPDEAAHALVAAIEILRPLVDRELVRFAREHDRAAQRDLARDLRRALRGFSQRLPQYELPSVRLREEAIPRFLPGAGEHAADGEAATEATNADREPLTADDLPPGVGELDAAEDPTVTEAESFELFAPGDLVSARIVPESIVLRPGRERRVRADALDEDGRVIRRPVSFAWYVEGTGDIEVRGDGARPALLAGPSARAGSVVGVLHVTVEEDGLSASASATIMVSDTDDAFAFDHGIPEPLFESDPRGSWRSRFEGARWIVNDAHEDWATLRADPRARLRYVLSLFAKDLVVRSVATPGASDALERMVEILAHAERNLRGAG